MQLGLLGLIVREGGFGGIEGIPVAFEYCRSRPRRASLVCRQPVGPKKIDPAEFHPARGGNIVRGGRQMADGQCVFHGKVAPRTGPYGDYDQLMRLDEWYGRGDA